MDNMNYDHAFWGVLFAGLFYVIGNAAWLNQWARQSRLLATIVWAVGGIAILLLAATFDMRLDPNLEMGVMDRLKSVDGENHWIALTLYALLSTPGISANLFALDLHLSRLSLILPALLVFIPMGQQLEHPDGNLLLPSLGATAAVIAVALALQMLLDAEPEKHAHRKGAAA